MYSTDTRPVPPPSPQLDAEVVADVGEEDDVDVLEHAGAHEVGLGRRAAPRRRPATASIVPRQLSRSMIFFTAIAAMMFSGMPELWPSPCPGAPSMIGSWYATPGFCDACGMPSMSEPSAITGLPDPHVADPRGRNAGHPSLDREAVLLEDAGEVLRRLEFLEAELAEAEDLSRPSAA